MTEAGRSVRSCDLMEGRRNRKQGRLARTRSGGLLSHYSSYVRDVTVFAIIVSNFTFLGVDVDGVSRTILPYSAYAMQRASR